MQLLVFLVYVLCICVLFKMVRALEGIKPLWKPDVDRRIILKWNVKEYDWDVDWICMGERKGNFMTSWETFLFSRMALLYGVS